MADMTISQRHNTTRSVPSIAGTDGETLTAWVNHNANRVELEVTDSHGVVSRFSVQYDEWRRFITWNSFN